MENKDPQKTNVDEGSEVTKKPRARKVKAIEILDENVSNSMELTEIPPENEIKETEISSVIEIEATEQLISEIEKTQKASSEIDYDALSLDQLIVMLENALESEDLNSIRLGVSNIKMVFIKKDKEAKGIHLNNFLAEGGKKEEYQPLTNPLYERFTIAFNKYKEKKNKFNEEQEKQKQENLAKKLQVLNELKLLVESEEELKKTYDAFKTMQDRWKEIGLVPKTEINNLWQNYNFLVEKFFDKVKINKELKDLDLKKNLEAKIELCEKTEELLIEGSITKVFNQLQKYHEKWREIGPVPVEKKDEIWERFHSATEKINERRREYYESQKVEQEKNAETKQALCEKAEQFSDSINNNAKEWQEQTDVLNDLLNTWKTIGPAHKKQNDELWIRFKTAIDAFFNNRKEYFGKLKDEQVNNYNEKLNLCIHAEALKNSNDWKRTTEELIRLQHEWKKIGPVPKKYSDKIWKRFRAACDEFFNNKSSYFSNIDSKEEENLKLKQELMQQLKEYQFGADNNENLKVIKEFQRKWMEIGHVPLKNKNDIHNEFRDIINANFDKLQLGNIEKNTIGFKSKFEAIANNPGSGHVISKEKTFIISKINSMKNDIKLWENNIGFFAKSKNANILKDEFLNKIEKAKEDIKVLEEKLKFLKEVK